MRHIAGTARQEAGRQRKKQPAGAMGHTAKLPGWRPGSAQKTARRGHGAHRRTARLEAGLRAKNSLPGPWGTPQDCPAGGRAPRKKQPAGAMDGPAGVKKVAGTGFEPVTSRL
jgi:hypothetical protein